MTWTMSFDNKSDMYSIYYSYSICFYFLLKVVVLAFYSKLSLPLIVQQMKAFKISCQNNWHIVISAVQWLSGG